MNKAISKVEQLDAISGKVMRIRMETFSQVNKMNSRKRYTGLIDNYRHRLPINNKTKVISLGEGNTPLIKIRNIMSTLDKHVDIYVKYEGLNPTGSFKDRGMTMAVTKAIESDAKAIICASTGNTSASAAAYAACVTEVASE